MSGLRTPVTEVYGEKASVPIVSARAFETPRLARRALAAGDLLVAVVPADVQAFELSVENLGGGPAGVLFLAAPSDDDAAVTTADDVALLVAAGIPRRVPAGAQLVEYRGAIPGDRVLVVSDAAVTVTVTAQRGYA